MQFCLMTVKKWSAAAQKYIKFKTNKQKKVM